MITLLIARHGNTFEDHEPLRRVGARTDIPLTQKGREQAAALGRYLKDNNLIPDSVYCSELIRTRETAEIALKTMDHPITVTSSNIFNEIDYGVDENKLESEVIERIGNLSLLNWEENFICPDGWLVNTNEILLNIRTFTNEMTKYNKESNNTLLVVTSNGIARFFTKILPHPTLLPPIDSYKLGTGNLAKMIYNNGLWSIEFWNKKPL